MIIRSPVYASTSDSKLFHASIENLMEVNAEHSVSLDTLHLKTKQLLKSLKEAVSARDIKTIEDRERYFLEIRELFESHCELLKDLDGIIVHSPTHTEHGRQFKLTDYGMPVAQTIFEKGTVACVGPYRLVVAECKLSASPLEVGKFRISGNLDLLNTQLPLRQHTFLHTQNRLNNLLTLTNKEMLSVKNLIDELDSKIGKLTMFTAPFASLFFASINSPDKFSNGFDDLITEAKENAIWNDQDGTKAQAINSVTDQKIEIMNLLNDVSGKYNSESLAHDVIEDLKTTNPLTWQSDLMSVGIDGIAYSDDRHSISASRGMPLPSQYEIFEESAISFEENVNAELSSLSKSNKNIVQPILAFESLISNLVLLDEFLLLLTLAKHKPSQLQSDNLTDRQKGLVKFYQLTRLDKLKLPKQADLDKEVSDSTLPAV
ncbi:hypothetical protein NB550_11920 [Vibrio parahaemolyticus]|uniref:hypothetical protein n=2 Tax=Vibrio parahaemolyticus TaxID=670 RepID=UPI00215CFE5A|nr:hypothetical protein [Vibrio parahaemolyticus]MCR9918200.1 hypothetical protein [Vibrio parahaemolyticus]